MANLLRAPILTPRWTPPYIHVGFVATNLLVTTLSLGANPFGFNADAFPDTVRGPAPIVHLLPAAPPNLITTLTRFQSPGRQLDWPNPTIAVPRALEDIPPTMREFVQDPIPFAQDQWPNPTLAVWSPSNHPPAYPSLLPGDILPFIQRQVLPNPTLPTVRNETLGFTQPINYTAFVAPNTKPFLLSDWPNPTLRPWTPTNYTLVEAQGFVGIGTPNPQPFSLADQPNPLLPSFATFLRIFTEPIPYSIETLPNIKPFGLSDQPNPLPVQARYQHPSHSRTLSEDPWPFAQYDWPLPTPQKPEKAAIYQFEISGVPYGAFTLPNTKPFLLLDQPNPTLPTLWSPNRLSWLNPVQHAAFVAANIQPFNLAQQPNPNLAVPFVHLLAVSEGNPITLGYPVGASLLKRVAPPYWFRSSS